MDMPFRRCAALLCVNSNERYGPDHSDERRRSTRLLINGKHATRVCCCVYRRSAGATANVSSPPVSLYRFYRTFWRIFLVDVLFSFFFSLCDHSQLSHIAVLSGARTRETDPKTRHCHRLRRCLLDRRRRGVVDTGDIGKIRRGARHSRSLTWTARRGRKPLVSPQRANSRARYIRRRLRPPSARARCMRLHIKRDKLAAGVCLCRIVKIFFFSPRFAPNRFRSRVCVFFCISLFAGTRRYGDLFTRYRQP